MVQFSPPPPHPFDVVILSNGPGEVLTWVRPVVVTLHRQMVEHHQRHRLRISVVLSPCTHASGNEAAILRSWPAVDRVQAAVDFWAFLLWGRTAERWSWHDRGVVVFLGGDRIFPVVVARRLGYRSMIYAEWETQWSGWVDRFVAMNTTALQTLPPRHRSKGVVVGDLIADAANLPRDDTDPSEQRLLAALSADRTLIALMPGSKPMKLAPLLPTTLTIADRTIERWRRDCPDRPPPQFIIPVAPTLSLSQLAKYADPHHNSFFATADWSPATLIPAAPNPDNRNPLDALPYLRTSAGNRIYLWSTSPAYSLLDRCVFCLTTIGANTAELGSLGIPMFVLLPTHQLDAMRAWDGVLGLLVRLPIVGDILVQVVNRLAWRWLEWRGGPCFAWPNIWAQRQGKARIISEFLGRFSAAELAAELCAVVGNPAKLAKLRELLRSVRGKAGAAQAIVQVILEEVQ